MALTNFIHNRLRSVFMLPKILVLGIFLLQIAPLRAQQKLNKSQAVSHSIHAVDTLRKAAKAQANVHWQQRGIDFGPYRMYFDVRVFGAKPLGGRSLYISMHGGGQGPAAMNDQQWQNQIELYKPLEGVYITPRSPTNTWNMWHQEHIDYLMDQLIKDAIVMEDVNPNKVYLMGYSAGGDGVYQLAPRMADYWAATAMMAGHPGDAEALNLRNLPFAIFMGGKDSAYDRNKLAGIWGKRLDSLERLNPGSYVHDLHIYPDAPHWMNRKDSVALPWLSSFVRNPLPKEVIWVQDDVLKTQFYWLGVPHDVAKQGKKTDVKVSGNTIVIRENHNKQLFVYLCDRLIDLDRPVNVVYEGKTIFKGILKRNINVIRETAARRLDPNLVFSVKLLIQENKLVKAL